LAGKWGLGGQERRISPGTQKRRLSFFANQEKIQPLTKRKHRLNLAKIISSGRLKTKNGVQVKIQIRPYSKKHEHC